MTIENPGYLFVLLPSLGLIALSFHIRHRRLKRLERYLSAEPEGGFWPVARAPLSLIDSWRRRGILAAFACASLVLGLVGVTVGTRTTRSYRPAAPLVLLIDISRSMAVDDVPWGRLGAAKLLARRVSGRFPGASIALTAFAEEPYSLLPLGPDRDLLNSYIDALDPEMVSHPGTSLVVALEESARVAELEATEAKPVFLLMSDGEDASKIRELEVAARSIREAGGRLAAVSFGSEAGGLVPEEAFSQSLLDAARGNSGTNGVSPPTSRANPDLLRSLAREGNGSFAKAQDAAEVNSLLTWLDSALGQGEGVRVEVEPVDRWPWLVSFAVLALLLEASFGGAFRKRVGVTP